MSLVFKDIISKLSNLEDLSGEEAEFALRQMINGQVSNEQIAAFLFGMRAKGERIEELTTFVHVMRDAAVSVEVETAGAVDLCGTGGDHSGTFNISTAAMFVAAGAGVPVLKHGNRSVSSRCGSADVLEELGVVVDLDKHQVEQVFSETGLVFMFAPNFHPAMKHVLPARKALGIRTFFNLLGPLLNPADVNRQVVGAYSRDAAHTIVMILSNLETEKAYTVNAKDGLDEVSTTADSEIFELHASISKTPVTFDPRNLGFERADIAKLKGGGRKENAGIINRILKGTSTKEQQDIVVLNAAFGIHVSGKLPTLEESVQAARVSIESGAANQKLNELVEASRNVS